MGLYDKEENGSVGSVSNCAGGQVVVTGAHNVPDTLAFGARTNVPMRYAYEDRVFLVGFALLVKRSVIDKVGLLDERFFPGNNEDVDLGLRILESGYHNVLCKNSFILHFGSKTFDKDRERYKSTAGRNRKKINEKWGFDVDHHLYPQTGSIKLIEEPMEKPLRILDVGCGCGASMGYIKGIYPLAETYGIELVPQVAKLAASMGTVLCGNVEKIEFPWEEGYFDYIFIGDILGHLTEPENVLKRLRNYLKEDGHIIVSMPNVKHYSIILPLLKWDVLPYSEAGILDRTHVKMCTGVEIQRSMIRSGYEVEVLDGVWSGEPNEQETLFLNGLQNMLQLPSKETFLVYKYILKARKK